MYRDFTEYKGMYGKKGILIILDVSILDLCNKDLICSILP